MQNGENIDLDPQIMQNVVVEKMQQLLMENIQLHAAVRQLSEDNARLKVVAQSANSTPSKDDTE